MASTPAQNDSHLGKGKKTDGLLVITSYTIDQYSGFYRIVFIHNRNKNSR